MILEYLTQKRAREVHTRDSKLHSSRRQKNKLPWLSCHRSDSPSEKGGGSPQKRSSSDAALCRAGKALICAPWRRVRCFTRCHQQHSRRTVSLSARTTTARESVSCQRGLLAALLPRGSAACLSSANPALSQFSHL